MESDLGAPLDRLLLGRWLGCRTMTTEHLLLSLALLPLLLASRVSASTRFLAEKEWRRRKEEEE